MTAFFFFFCHTHRGVVHHQFQPSGREEINLRWVNQCTIHTDKQIDTMLDSVRSYIDSDLIAIWHLLCKQAVTSFLNVCVRITDIQERSQTLYTIPCNGVVSYGAQIGGLWVFANHTCKNKHKAIASTIIVRHAAFCACLFSSSNRSRCKWNTHLMNHIYFDYRKDPQFEPHARIKMAQVLGSP